MELLQELLNLQMIFIYIFFKELTSDTMRQVAIFISPT